MTEAFFAAPRWKDEVRHLVNEFVKRAASSVRPSELILDAGAGECAYAPLFSHARYESADLAVGDAAWNYGRLTYRCDLTAIPTDSGRFDHVLCTQTLEHVPDPRGVVREFARVLKTGGSLWLTAPFGSPMHQEPHDYWRYTEHGLRSLLSREGFVVEEVLPCGGYFVHLNHELSYFKAFATPALGLGALALLPFVDAARWLLWHADRLDTQKSYTMNYLVRATRA